jgi:hypothetical protein
VITIIASTYRRGDYYARREAGLRPGNFRVVTHGAQLRGIGQDEEVRVVDPANLSPAMHEEIHRLVWLVSKVVYA